MESLELLWTQFSVPLVPSHMGNFLPNLALAVAIGLIVGGWAAPRLGLTRRAAGALWLTCLLAPLAYTLSAIPGDGLSGCEVGLIPWQSTKVLLSIETRSNLVLLMPAGAAALLFPSGPRRLAALGAALAMPAAIEITQLLMRHLRRACQGTDVFNNTLGVVLGFCLAAGVWAVWDALSRAHPNTGGAREPNLGGP